MLTRYHSIPDRNRSRTQQRGVVLFIALIALVAMTLAAIALVRSVDTSNVIAGNLAFQQAATHSGDTGTEAAILWLEQNNTGNILFGDSPANGYSASWQPPIAAGQTWDNYWTATLAARSRQVMFDANGIPSTAGTNATDAAGNTVFYAIQRMCNQAGVAPTDPAAGCSVVPAATVLTKGNSQESSSAILKISGQVYYRITAKITGPRHTVSYVQAIVAM